MNIIKNNALAIVGAIIGAMAGFIYWEFVGCNSGSCAITSSPTYSTLYGSFLGVLLFISFKKERKKAI